MILSFETGGRDGSRAAATGFEGRRLGNEGAGRCFGYGMSFSFGVLSAHPMAVVRRRVEYQDPIFIDVWKEYALLQGKIINPSQ